MCKSVCVCACVCVHVCAHACSFSPLIRAPEPRYGGAVLKIRSVCVHASTQERSISSPQNYRLLANNGCIYRLFANVVRDLMDWALAEHQIPDSQFGFCPTRNTNQPLFILRHILATAKKKKMKVFTAFLDLLAAYGSIPREKLWRHLQKKIPTIFGRYHPNHVHRMPLPSY